MPGLLSTALSLFLACQPQPEGPTAPSHDSIPALQRAVISVPVGVLAGTSGSTVLTDTIEVRLDRPLLDQLPRTAAVLVLDGDTPRAHAKADEQAGLPAPSEVEVTNGGVAWIPPHAGVFWDKARADAAQRAAIAAGRATTVPIRYTHPDEIRPLAYGPPTLLCKDAAGYFAIVPGRVVIDDHGGFAITFKEVGPFAAEPTPDDLPRAVPVFSIFGTEERPGAFQRNYSGQGVDHLDDRRAKEFIFCPGLGYQFVQEGPTGVCGGGWPAGVPRPPPRYQPGASEPECMPGSQTASIRYTPYSKTIRSLTPTISWMDGVRRHHVFIREGAMVYDELDVVRQRDIAGDRLALPRGALRPGMTYHLLVTAEPANGYYFPRSMVFTTAAEAREDANEGLDITADGKEGQ